MALRSVIAAIFVLALMRIAMFDAAMAAMTSTNYQILWDSVGVGGSDTTSSASYQMRDSLGGMTMGTGTGTNYQLQPGYRAGIYDQVVTFNAYAQVRSSQVAASSLVGKDITVTSVTGFATGQRIALVQNEGASQVVAYGEITGIVGNILTVDALTTNGTTPTIDGAEDYVYRLSGNTVDLGTLSTSAVSTSVIGWEIDADVSQGYSVYVFENRDLTSSGTSMVVADVSDGAVTAGSAEYGAVSSDTTLSLSTFDTQDSAITTSLQQVASRSDNSYSNRDFMVFKVGMSSAMESATYSNTVSLVFVGDY